MERDKGKEQKPMFYETATAHGRIIPPQIRAELAKLKARSKPISPDGQRRERMLRDYRLRDLNFLIKEYGGKPDFAASLSKWRSERIDLLERF